MEEDTKPSIRFLGNNSVPAFLSDRRSPNGGESAPEGGETLRNEILPMLGLETPAAPYPFMSMESRDKVRQDISNALPPDKEVLKYVCLLQTQVHLDLVLTVADYSSCIGPL